MIQMKIGQASARREHFEEEANNNCLKTNLDLLVERIESPHTRGCNQVEGVQEIQL